MRTYKIKETAGYKGCGPAFAKIEGDIVVELTYVDSLVTLDDWDCVDDNDPNGDQLRSSGEAKVQLFTIDHPDLVEGMCSCGEFCV